MVFIINYIIILLKRKFNVQTSCAVRNSDISLADVSALMSYNARFSCLYAVVSPFPTFYELQAVILSYHYLYHLFFESLFRFNYFPIWIMRNILIFLPLLLSHVPSLCHCRALGLNIKRVRDV